MRTLALPLAFGAAEAPELEDVDIALQL